MPKGIAVRKAYRSSIMDDPRHLLRWLKAQAVGGSGDVAARAVAKAERVSVETVKASIREVDAYRSRNDRVEFDYAIRDFVISTIPQAKATLNGLLAATELVEIKNEKTGKVRVEKMEDKTTRLEALRVLNSLVGNLQPKSPIVEVNNTQTNQVAQIASGTETTEDRLRRLRKQAAQHRLKPPEVAAVPEYLDEGGSAADEDDDEDDGDEEGDA